MAPATQTAVRQAMKRREDPRSSRAAATTVDDVSCPACRTPRSCAPPTLTRASGPSSRGAKAHPGVVAVFTGKDMTGVNRCRAAGPPQRRTSRGVIQDLASSPTCR